MITKEDIKGGLSELGIKEGDNIFVTSSLSRFGIVEGGAKTVVEALREVVNGGTIVMPSFNFGIFKQDKIILDIDNTPSEMGAISEYFRKTATHRTTNLFHPVSHEGKLSNEIRFCDMVNTWGEKSVYGYMLSKDFKIVMLGTDFYSCPIFHFCEQRNNVPYREQVEYRGEVIVAGGVAPVICRRLRRKYGDSDNNKVYGKFPTKENKIGKAICRSFEISALTAFLDAQMQQDPNYLLSTEDLLSPMPTMDSFDMMEGLQELFKLPRNLVSQGFKDGLDYISKFIPLRYHTWKSGEKVWTWTIPQGDIDIMYVGEYTVKGFSNKTILLPIHLDHANMANDNLSGVAVAMALIERLQRTADLEISYKFLFVPETIGTLAYLSRFGTEYLGGIIIDSVGTKDNLVVTKTKFPHALNNYIEGDTNEFLSAAHLWSGNDERVLECCKIPAIQFSRSPFRQYHTFQDTPDIIVEGKLEETLNEVYNYILRMERDFVPIPTYQGVPCLSSVGLWELDLGLEKIYHLIGYGFSIAQIAKMIDMSFDYVYKFVRKMEGKRLVKR